ncbi:MAG TPA: membrane protein insertase YidC [Pyrinomonadaceae bacterium]|nr:membrane protein insertase YidC [Pyrinomonadaceae bacterium]
MQQKRFLLAITISALILFGWSYVFPPPKPQQQPNANTSGAQPSPSAQPDNAAATTASPAAPQQSAEASNTAAPASQDSTPQRNIKISSPYYEVELDNRGAVAKSWVITRIINLDYPNDLNKAREVYSVGGTKQKLELIPAESLRNNLAPLRVVTGDQKTDEALASRNYKVTVDGKETEESIINVAAGQPKSIAFNMRDEATGLDVVKTLTFYPDRYIADIKVQLKRGDQTVPNAKLLIGPSIGDQGIPHYSFYSVAPEGIAVVGGKVERLHAQSINETKESPDRKALNGAVNWAGVGDTYFAMIAVPARPTEGLEYRTSKYEREANGTKEARYLITGYVPIPTDNSATHLYVGPKDHYLLTAASKQIQQEGVAYIDLEESIDYGFLSTLSRPLAVPILWSIKKLYQITGSYGWAIILFTIVIYSLFFPLKWRSSKAMKKAAKMAPKMKELQEKIKGMKQNDPKLKELQMEQLRLMKEGNPLGGCLPLLIQMPFLFALYRAITISIDFRQASFLWIPDLSAAEPTTIHLLPLLFAGSMMVLQLITPQPSADPLQRKMMAIGMPIFMLYMLWSAPAGLLVYWLVGNIVGFSQQLLINRMTKSDDEEPPKKVEATTKKLGSTPRVSQA